MMPAHRGAGLYESADPVAAIMDICNEGRSLFGIDHEVPENEIVRVTLVVEAVEVGKYEVRADFKPLTPVVARRTRKRS